MATTTSRFTHVVRTKLQENKDAGRKPDSIRSLAKTLSNGSEAREATYRRSLFKWLVDDPKPSADSRNLVADALGLERDSLDEDDEESDELDLFADILLRRLQKRGLVVKRNEEAARPSRERDLLATEGVYAHGNSSD